MRAFITGGAGFLGYHLANYLSPRGWNSTVFDLEAIDAREYPPDTTAVRGDVRDAPRLERALSASTPDVIVHAAAALPLWRPEDIHSVNVNGTRVILRLARKLGIDRVVFISSTAVYGVPKTHPLLESHPMQGVGPYGESKIGAETACVKARSEGLCVSVIRPKTFIGTGRLGVFQILCDWVESGVRIPMIGSGANAYQLLDVEDLCEAIRLAMTAPRHAADDVFNVGSADLRPVRDYLGELCSYADTGSRPLATPAGLVKILLRALEIMRLSPLYKWVYGTADTDSYVSTEKIANRLGWQPRYSNSDALIRCYQWYLEHKTEVEGATGITHRVAWRQGALGVFKRVLKVR